MDKKNLNRLVSEQEWQEGAGGLLLLAAVHETERLSQLEAALPMLPFPSPVQESSSQRLSQSQRCLLLTLLFLNAVGLHRLWDLRSYTGQELALLTSRQRPYSYRHTERFLRILAQAHADHWLSEALARWTATLWQAGKSHQNESSPPLYLDGHRKAVYTQTLIPRGRIGRTGKIVGCRALVLLHDEQGHPLLATTHRGDLHLTTGIPHLLTFYEQATEGRHLINLVVDREAMAADFLAQLRVQGRTRTTILKTNQYAGLASFMHVGSFVPLPMDRDGTVLREVAPAQFLLARPDRREEPLLLSVALIRDLRRSVLSRSSEEDLPRRWNADIRDEEGAWWQEGWQATPAPARPTEPKLLPLVTPATGADALELAQTYIPRWPAQEKIIRDWLLPLGLDYNHGYAKAPVQNSEVSKKREALEKRLRNVQQWGEAARLKAQRASLLARRLGKEAKAHGEQLYRSLNQRLHTLKEQGVTQGHYRAERNRQKAEVDAEVEISWQRGHRVEEKSAQESRKHERYCCQQREFLRALEDLRAGERVMHELDNRKDQIMTVCKLALANLAMWVRDRFFPSTYAQATWQRLLPFFRLAGRVQWEREVVHVELRPFNSRQLTRDLVAVCQRVNEVQPRLPDGRLLMLHASSSPFG